MSKPGHKPCDFARQILSKVTFLERERENSAPESQPPLRCGRCALCSWVTGCPQVSDYVVYARHSGIYEVKLTFKEANETNGSAESTSRGEEGKWLRGNLLILPADRSSNNVEPNKFEGTTKPGARTIWTQTKGPLLMKSRLETVARMLKECDTGARAHKNCLRPDDWLPSRLIKISRSSSDSTTDTRNAVNLRLVKSSQIDDEDTRYITLSHCWGQHGNFSGTLQSNLSGYLSEIPWEELPKTFQDVALASDCLGIHYLWIDSLCIIQDDRQDWQHESSLMARVYSNSYLNIAAMSGDSSDSGLALQIDLTSEVKIKESWTSRSRAFLVRRIRLTADGILDGVINSPLIERAWVLQETYLARRNLYFCNDQYYYECHGFSFSEDGISEYHRGLSRDLLHLRFSTLPITFKRIWRVVVEDYSGRKLTYKSDKIPGIAGVIQDITLWSPHNLRNVAGVFIWDEHEKSLLNGILWRSCAVTSTRPRIPSIPTWSWASVDGPVLGSFIEQDLDSERDYPEVHILDIHMEWEGQEMTSKIKSAYLDLSVLLFEAEVEEGEVNDQTAQEPAATVPTQVEGQVGVRLPKISVFRDTGLDHSGYLQSASEFVGSAFLDCAQSPTRGQVACLCFGEHASWLGREYVALDGLLLEKQPSQSMGTGPTVYKRVARVILKQYSQSVLDGSKIHQDLIDYSCLERQTIRLV